MDLFETTAFDVCVNLRRRDIGMTEHCLDRAQVGPALEQMRRKGMPQHVRRDCFRNTGAARSLAKQLPERLSA